jgi:hypothetical protein
VLQVGVTPLPASQLDMYFAFPNDIADELRAWSARNVLGISKRCAAISALALWNQL